MSFNLILATDSYKFSHAPVYPDWIIGSQGHIMPRVKGKWVVLFMLQAFIKEYLLTPITQANIDEAQAFAALHGEPFDPKPWQLVISRYNGYLPITIRAVPEGLPVASGHPLVTVECTDPDLWWLSFYVETALLRAVWYPTTIASLDLEFKRALVHMYKMAGEDPAGADFALHDFGGRGVTCSEQARIGGGAHTLLFRGSDTVEGVWYVNKMYGSLMSAFSVPATEHSIQTAYGENGEREYVAKVLDTYAKPGAIVSLVIDGYDTMRLTKMICTEFKDKIVSSGALKVVLRPDSGDMFEVVPAILKELEDAFGYTLNSKGYKLLNGVGVLQGDGITRESGLKLINKIMLLGYAPSNLVLGSGGGLLQQVNRDTYRFAQKANAMLSKDGWVGVRKNPATDPTKASPAGYLSTFRHVMTGEFATIDMSKPVSNEFIDAMQTVYVNGKLLVDEDLETIRARLPV